MRVLCMYAVCVCVCVSCMYACTGDLGVHDSALLSLTDDRAAAGMLLVFSHACTYALFDSSTPC